MPEDRSATPLILVVDDEPDIVDLIRYNLEKIGLKVVSAHDGQEALEVAERSRPDLIVLDIMMPRMDGIEACKAVRAHLQLSRTPILMLTARSEETDHTEGLDVGADIYLTKPISVPVLMSQVKALLRGAARYEVRPDRIAIHELEIDRDRFVVFRGSGSDREELSMPRKEFELLYFLATHPGRVYSRADLLDEVWGRDVFVVDRTVDVHIRKIREKVGDHYIQTVKGVGYRFLEESPQ